MNLLKRIPRATIPSALGSLVSLAAQGIFALFLLKLFDADAVGIFSVISQISFCWATLALAQSPVSLLANHHNAPRYAAATAWRQSLRRMFWLAPLMMLAVYWSQTNAPLTKLSQINTASESVFSFPGWISLASWACLIAFTQMSWLLAQSLTLRTQGPRDIALVRMVPPVLATLLAWTGAQGLSAPHTDTLLLASLLGYSVGMIWMHSALPCRRAEPQVEFLADRIHRPSDPRSTRLKMLHTLTDVLCSTALAIQWQSLYGPTEAGYLLVLLRVFGFIPGLVHTAWAQALISRPLEQKLSPMWVALAASAVITLLIFSLEAALHWQWIAPSWQKMRSYILPLALWQMASCLSAAHAHLPFFQSRTRQFSLQSIALNTIMATLLVINPMMNITATIHIYWISGFMFVGLSLQTLYFVFKKELILINPAR